MNPARHSAGALVTLSPTGPARRAPTREAPVARIKLHDLPAHPPAPEALDDDALEGVAGGTFYVTSYSPTWWAALPIPIPEPSLLPGPTMPGALPVPIP